MTNTDKLQGQISLPKGDDDLSNDPIASTIVQAGKTFGQSANFIMGIRKITGRSLIYGPSNDVS